MNVSPVSSDTHLASTDPHVWIPRTFKAFIAELEHLRETCCDRLLLFRGQANYRWLLDSSFVRSCKRVLLDVDPWVRPSEEVRDSVEYHQALFALFLFKFDLCVKPSNELTTLEDTHGIDPRFELFKRFQQYPAEDRSMLKGASFMDWSENANVALFFANCSADELTVQPRSNDSALFVCDASATGGTLMRDGPKAVKVEEIVQRMVKSHEAGEAFGCPLLFHPPKQMHMLRAEHQKAIYWAQMDLRYDFEHIWRLQEQQQAMTEQIYVKLVLPYAARQSCERYLAERGITHSYLFPD